MDAWLWWIGAAGVLGVAEMLTMGLEAAEPEVVKGGGTFGQAA